METKKEKKHKIFKKKKYFQNKHTEHQFVIMENLKFLNWFLCAIVV